MIPWEKTKLIYIALILINVTEAILFSFPQPEEEILSHYDFIIIGSGSAGSVLANRLSEVPQWKILLLEVGRRPTFLHDIPVLAPALQFTDYNWAYKMKKTPNACLGLVDQKCPWPRGRGLGGSSLINYMIYTRGNRLDYDKWAAQGNPGWSYADVLPYFKKSETASFKLQDAQFHGHSGKFSVEDVNYRTKIVHSFISGGRERGYPYVDYNGKSQDGYSYVQANTKNGRRSSGYTAFIKPAQRRPNLHILTESRATKILIDPNTKQAYGVEFVKNNKYHTVNITKEIILSAGALASPQLLMLSGIGPKRHLESLGIQVIQDLSVGKNLQDHITFTGLVFELNATVSAQQSDIENPISILRWFLKGEGPLVSLGGVEGLAYIHTNVSQDEGVPDMEFIFVSGSMNTDRGQIYRRVFGIPDETYNEVWKPLEGKSTWSILPMLQKPKSVGYMELASKNPYHFPKFYGNYYSDPENLDIKAFIVAIREIQKLSNTHAFQRYGSKLHTIPIPGCDMNTFDTDDYWECALRHLSTTLHHQVGTCKMGPGADPSSVVDHECKVHGIQNLRVADTSIIPFAIAAHTSAPAFMVGEKIADQIKQTYNNNSL